MISELRWMILALGISFLIGAMAVGFVILGERMVITPLPPTAIVQAQLAPWTLAEVEGAIKEGTATCFPIVPIGVELGGNTVVVFMDAENAPIGIFLRESDVWPRTVMLGLQMLVCADKSGTVRYFAHSVVTVMKSQEEGLIAL